MSFLLSRTGEAGRHRYPTLPDSARSERKRSRQSIHQLALLPAASFPVVSYYFFLLVHFKMLHDIITSHHGEYGKRPVAAAVRTHSCCTYSPDRLQAHRIPSRSASITAIDRTCSLDRGSSPAFLSKMIP